jgi:hypothetical protein
MNSQIEVWRSIAYANNVFHLSQQMGSMITPKLGVVDTFVGKAKMYDRLGEATAQDKASRNEDTPNLDIAHTRRMLTTVTVHWGTLVDDKDKVAQIHDPMSEYSKASLYGIGRRMDQKAIRAAFANAASGEDGTSTVSLPNAQKVVSVASSAIAVPNIQMLRKAKLIFGKNSVKGKRYCFHDAEFLDALLAATEVTSSDYNTVKSLVAGELNTFMGFEFVECEELATVLAGSDDAPDANGFRYDASTGMAVGGGTALAGTEKVCLFLSEGALQAGKNPTQKSKIDERADKCYSAQLYAAIDCGYVRMEEARIVQGIFKAS